VTLSGRAEVEKKKKWYSFGVGGLSMSKKSAAISYGPSYLLVANAWFNLNQDERMNCHS
jgi:hypothetical protein